MKTILTNLRMLCLLVVFSIAAKAGFSQGVCPTGAPTFDMYIANDTATGPNTFQFDIFMVSTTGSDITLRTTQFGINIDPASIGTGILDIELFVKRVFDSGCQELGQHQQDYSYRC